MGRVIGKQRQFRRKIRVITQKRNRNPIGRKLRTDPGGKAHQDSDRDLKTNERSVAKKYAFIK